jgi:hypothetical protein
MNPLNHLRRNSAIILILILLAALLYFLAARTPVHSTVKKPSEVIHKEPVKQDFQDASFEGNGKWYGLCKKNSIHSIDDFRKTVANDPALKAHFADFKWENATMGKLEKAIQAYVYYRKNDTIFRKKTPITLPTGDGYITDGNTRVRTMCCNSYAAAPPAYGMSDLDAEPAAGPAPMNVNNYSPPALPVENPTPEKIVDEPLPLPPANKVVPPVIPLIPDYPGNEPLPPGSHDTPEEPKKPPPPEPRPVPINPTVWLFGTGLIALIGLRRRYKKQD